MIKKTIERIRTNLVWKMTLLMTLLLIIPISILGINYYSTYENTVNEESKNDLHSAMSKLEENVETSLSEANTFISELIYRIEFPYYLDADNKMSQDEMTYYISTFHEEQINARYIYSQKFNSIGVYSENKQIEETPYLWQYYLEDFKQKEYYSEVEHTDDEIIYGKIRNKDLVSTNLDLSELKLGDSGIRVLPVYKKIYSLNSDKMVGVIEVDLDIIRLTNPSSLNEEQAELILLSEEDEILMDTYNFTEEEYEVILQSINQAAEDQEVTLSSGRFRISYKNESNTGLQYVSLISVEKARKELRASVVNLMLVMICIVFFMATITYVIIRNILKRLLVLDKMIGKVGEGNFNVSIPEKKEADEIGRITHSFNKMAEKLENLLAQELEKEKMKKEAELKALQAQINPHFLYNTLENMRMQCEIDEYYTISNSLSVLGELFRYSISWNTNEVPFALEWKNLKNYLEIMQMRFDDDLECVLECEHDIEDIIVPKLILQPLVENCFNHGFKNTMPPWKLHVSVVKEKEEVVKIIICDNGLGITEDKLNVLRKNLKNKISYDNDDTKRKSIGVINVNYRIKMICKEGSQLEIFSKESEGTKIEIKIVV